MVYIMFIGFLIVILLKIPKKFTSLTQRHFSCLESKIFNYIPEEVRPLNYMKTIRTRRIRTWLENEEERKEEKKKTVVKI